MPVLLLLLPVMLMLYETLRAPQILKKQPGQLQRRSYAELAHRPSAALLRQQPRCCRVFSKVARTLQDLLPASPIRRLSHSGTAWLEGPFLKPSNYRTINCLQTSNGGLMVNLFTAAVRAGWLNWIERNEITHSRVGQPDSENFCASLRSLRLQVQLMVR